MSWVNKEKTELALSPTKWHASKLSELAKIKSGDGITSEDIHDSGDYPCYGGNGLRGWVSNWNREGDHCLVGRQGALCGNVKRVAGKYYASEHAIVFEPKPKVDPDWLYHRLVSLNLNRFSESSAQPGLAVSKIASLRIAAPPLREQTKIGEILSTWDKSIEATERLLANSKKRKKALMQQLLTGKKRLAGFGPTKEFVTTKYGEMPSDWEFVKISDFASQKSIRANADRSRRVLSCSKHEGFVDSLSYFKKQVFSEDTSNYKVVKRNWFGFPANHVEEGSIGLQNICDEGIVSPIYIVFAVDEKKCIPEYLYPILKKEHYKQIFAASTNASVDRRGSLRWDGFGIIKVRSGPAKLNS